MSLGVGFACEPSASDINFSVHARLDELKRATLGKYQTVYCTENRRNVVTLEVNSHFGDEVEVILSLSKKTLKLPRPSRNKSMTMVLENKK